MATDHLGPHQPLLDLPATRGSSGQAYFDAKALCRKIQLDVRLRRAEGWGSVVTVAAALFRIPFTVSSKRFDYWPGMASACNLPYRALV